MRTGLLQVLRPADQPERAGARAEPWRPRRKGIPMEFRNHKHAEWSDGVRAFFLDYFVCFGCVCATFNPQSALSHTRPFLEFWIAPNPSSRPIARASGRQVVPH